MLRTVIKEISKLGLRCSLCVNVDNEDAVKLYLSEGFYEKEVVVAMSYDI
jgi:ribosomal protein S18 acetylase RimI-like enzyme